VALSALIGGGVCLAANAFVAFWVFRRYRAQDPGLLVMRFYGAEVAKIALILGLFAVAFVTIESLNVPALLSAYLVVQVLPAFFASVGGARSDRER
jgi:ATP synthase protein I